MDSNTFNSVLAGGAITLIVSLVCFVLAGNQLKTESQKLRKKVDLVLFSLQQNGLIELVLDSKGEVIAINLKINVLPGEQIQVMDVPKVEVLPPEETK